MFGKKPDNVANHSELDNNDISVTMEPLDAEIAIKIETMK